MSIPSPRDGDTSPTLPPPTNRPAGKKPAAENWRPYWKPGFEINDRGQLRTVDHKPPTREGAP